MFISTSTSRYAVRAFRPTASEIASLAYLYTQSYRRQFFDPSGPLKGALGKQFPVLERYEDFDCFFGLWQKLALKSAEPEDPAYGFVATEQVAGTDQIVGFVKGGSWKAGADMRKAVELQTPAFSANEVAELGSIYVRPEDQGKGIGRLLVQRLSREVLARGFQGMMTRAYAKNLSPRFFEGQTGACLMGSCLIPYGYNAKLLQAKGLRREDMPDAIPGVWLYWNKAALEKLSAPQPKEPRIGASPMFPFGFPTKALTA